MSERIPHAVDAWHSLQDSLSSARITASQQHLVVHCRVEPFPLLAVPGSFVGRPGYIEFRTCSFPRQPIPLEEAILGLPKTLPERAPTPVSPLREELLDKLNRLLRGAWVQLKPPARRLSPIERALHLIPVFRQSTGSKSKYWDHFPHLFGERTPVQHGRRDRGR